MWLKRLFIFGAVFGVLLGLGVRFAPPQWFRKAGILDFALLADYSGSYANAFPVTRKEAPRLLDEILPGDRLAVLAVGPQVIDLFTGVVPSGGAVSVVQRQIRALQVNTNGTELGQAFVRVRKAFEDFAAVPSQDGVRRRILAIFSDCIDTPASQQAFDVGTAQLPGHISVLVVGMQGSEKDAVTRALLGRDGNNDLHVVPPDEAPQATRAWLKSIRQAHPVKVAPVVGAVLGGLLLAAALTYGVEVIGSGSSRPIVIALCRRGEEDSLQEFPLADGETVLIGGGNGPVDFHVPVDGQCSVSRQGRALTVAPGSGTLLIRRAGLDLPVKEPVPVFDHDALVFDSREIELMVH